MTVTGLPTPTSAVANDAAAEHVTTSPLTRPASTQFEIVAAVVPSYDLFATVTVAVSAAAVIEAVVVAVDDVST